jgi:hypothetical protein
MAEKGNPNAKRSENKTKLPTKTLLHSKKPQKQNEQNVKKRDRVAEDWIELRTQGHVFYCFVKKKKKKKQKQNKGSSTAPSLENLSGFILLRKSIGKLTTVFLKK